MKKITVVFALLPSIALCFSNLKTDVIVQEHISELKKMGLLTPDSGVQLVPRSELMAEKWQKERDALAQKQQKKMGYLKEDSARAKELLNFEEVKKAHAPMEKNLIKPSDTYLRKHTEDMIMAYPFVGVPTTEMDEYLGIAPVGSYIKQPATGWTGAVQFFKNSLGTCAYTENNLQISHGAARIAREDAGFDINGKTTLLRITGTDASGYLYQVKWFDDHFIRELECANQKYSANTTAAVIALAKRIDSN